MNPLVTIQNLIALACGSHSEEESRTSAVAACKAIVRHKVILSLPRVTEDPFLTRLSDAARKSREPPRSEPPKPNPPEPAKPRPPKSYQSGTKMYERDSKKPVRVVAKYEAFCAGCGAECEVGTPLWWRRGAGVTCMSCGPKKLEDHLDVEV